MSEITTIGLDLAKNVFQVRGVDTSERVVVHKRLRRGQVLTWFAGLSPCLVGMEAYTGGRMRATFEMIFLSGWAPTRASKSHCRRARPK